MPEGFESTLKKELEEYELKINEIDCEQTEKWIISLFEKMKMVVKALPSE